MAQLTMVDPSRDILFSSMYGGYAGSGSSVLPPAVVLTSSFWDDQKIDSTVTTLYIKQKLPSDVLRRKLEEPIDVSGELTDSTFLEWIMERSKRLFLIMSDLGCAEKIFDLIDGSTGAWEDDDLPVSAGSLETMKLGANLEKKFLKKQYLFLLRDLEPGSHMDYNNEEQVPLEVIFKPTTRGQNTIEKVYYPRHRDVYYSRKRIPLATEKAVYHTSRDGFFDEIDALKKLIHPHIISLHASYTYQDQGYLLLSPVIELNLKTFIQYPTSTFKNLPKEKRKLILIDWMHCLADAIAYLHEQGVDQNEIKPSSVIVDSTTNKVYLADVGEASKTNRDNKSSQDEIEAYEYAAPELWIRTMMAHETSGLAPSTVTSGRIKRRQPRRRSDAAYSPPASPVLERSVHLGAWTSPKSLDHEKSDVFSLGCVSLDILTFYAKRRSSAFISHRSAKNRRPRESAPPDASFHGNLGQVDAWIEQLEKHAGKKMDRPLAESLSVVREMLVKDPAARPGLRRTEENMYRVALSVDEAEMPHCGCHTVKLGGVDPGLALLGGWGSVGSGTSSGAVTPGDEKSGFIERRNRFTSMTTSSHGTTKSSKSKRSTASSVGGIFGITLGRGDE